MSWMKRGRSCDRDASSVLRGFKKVIFELQPEKCIVGTKQREVEMRILQEQQYAQGETYSLPLTILIFSG